MDCDFVYTVKDVIPKSLCDQIINKFEEDKKFHVAGAMGDENHKIYNKEWKNSTEIFFLDHVEWYDITCKLEEYIRYALDEYLDEVNKFLKKVCEPDGEGDSRFAFHYALGDSFSINNMSAVKVTKCNRYRWHNDENKSNPGVILTIIIYLNTLEPSEGGKTKFISGKEVRPVAGNILFLPAKWTCIHSGERVHGDAKYMLVGGIIGEQRQEYKGK
jgi:hypothetical protein